MTKCLIRRRDQTLLLILCCICRWVGSFCYNDLQNSRVLILVFLRHACWILLTVALLTSCGGRKDVNRRGEIKLRGERPVKMKKKKPGDLLQKGVASWYGQPFHGRKTSNGETYNMWALTAAHKTIPFGTWVRVRNLDNGRETFVRINDRGPFIRGRVIDLSRKAAEAIGLDRSGIANVGLYLAERPDAGEQLAPERQTAPSLPQPTRIWTVQIASFQNLTKAVDLADQLAPRYQGIRIERANGFFRVRVGQFSNREKAQDLASRLRSEGFEPWITKKL